jgi:hypothetical protein
MSPSVIIDDPGVYAWIARLSQIRAQKKFWAEAEKDAVAQLRGALGTGDTGETVSIRRPDGSEVASDRVSITRRVDPALLRETYPDVAEAVTVETVTRQFRLADNLEGAS